MRNYFALPGLFIFLLASSSISVSAQKMRQIKGRLTDASTKEPLGYVTVASPEFSLGTRSEDDGSYSIRSDKPIKELRFSCIGYTTVTMPVSGSGDVVTLNVALEPQTSVLKEVVVKPKRYRNKDNPAVELIELVIQNRDRNRVENFNSYRVEQYEKVMMGLSNVSDKNRNRRMLRSWKFVLDNVDTTKLEGAGVIPMFLQESIQDFHSQGDPKRSKTLVKATQKVRLPLMDEEGLEKYLRYLYQETNIYDNYIVLLTNDFLSPVANNAPLFYRYYPADTIEDHGSKVVRLQFFPRNKTDMLLQGELFIALDSTYPVTHATFSIPSQINMNWVKGLECEMRFQKMPESGKWVLSEENYAMDFGLSKRSMGIFGERYVSHRLPELGVALPDSIFEKTYEKRTVLKTAEQRDTSFWNSNRHIGLDAAEVAVYRNMDSLQRTLLFRRIAKTSFIILSGFWKPVPGLELGRINTIYSFNPVEGDRFRFGLRTTPELSKRVNFEGYGAYGLLDKRWKFGVGLNISMSKRPYNRFPYNLLRINYQEDLLTPGVIPIGTFAPTSLATSITRGTNDKFFFQKRFLTQYEHEFTSRFSFMVGFERKELAPLGSLLFVPTDDVLPEGSPVTTSKPFVQVRYAPGEEFYETQNSWRQRIRFRYIAQLRYARGMSGVLGGQYNFDELTASFYKFSKLPPIGYNYFYLEGGAVFGKVPYPLLTLHRANQTFGYRFMAYNLMNFMEFVSDRYVAMHMEQSFYGFFLNKVPLVKRLKLREFTTLKVIYGQVSEQNQPTIGSGLYKFPTYPDGSPLTYTLENKPYVEASVGIGNIFKAIRIDLVRRFTYLEHPQTAKYGVRVAAQLQF